MAIRCRGSYGWKGEANQTFDLEQNIYVGTDLALALIERSPKWIGLWDVGVMVII